MAYRGSGSESEKSSNPCSTLLVCAEEQCDGRASDALCIFLQTHLCVCRQESSLAASEQLKALNRAFAEKMVSVYTSFKRRDDEKEALQLHPLWVNAFNLYLDDKPVVVVLASMAAAHILGDLERLLVQNPVTREEYDRVFDDIARCVNNTTKNRIQPKQFLDYLYERMRPILDPARDYSVKRMREVAWKMARERKRLMQRGS
jgi:hypothetical protein